MYQGHPIGANIFSQGSIIYKRNIVAAEKQAHHYRTAQKHIDVFCKKKEAQLHRRVLCVIAANQFVLCFGQIEWGTVTFCKGAN